MVEMLIGLNVVDEQGYQAYRDAMTPILQAHGGGFGHDFRISETLRSTVHHPVNRVFTIHFPDDSAMDAFFQHEEYRRIRALHFEPAVSHLTVLATYEPREGDGR